jgi:F-type H+-transporting ATPase subunit b
MRKHSLQFVSVAATLGLALLAPALAMASGAEHEAGQAVEHATEHAAHLDLKTLALQLFNFSILLFMIIKFGGGGFKKALANRHTTLKQEIATANQLRADAETRLAEQEKRLSNLEKEIEDMRLKARENAQSEKARLVATAEEKANRITTETKFLIEQQVKQAEQSFRSEVATAAAKLAEQLVRKSIGPADQSRLVDGFVGELDGGKN